MRIVGASSSGSVAGSSRLATAIALIGVGLGGWLLPSPISRAASASVDRLLGPSGGLLLAIAAGTAFLLYKWRPSSRAANAERRYETYWRDTDEGLFTVRITPEGFVFEGLNPAHERRTGLSQTQLTGRRPDEVLPPGVAAAITARYRACVERGTPISYAETLDLPGGRRHWETSLAPLRNAGGAIEALLGSARDVTDRVEAEIALGESEARFRSLTELVPDILFTASARGRPDYVSAPFYIYTGLGRSSTAASLMAAVHPEDRSRLTPSAPVQPGDRFQREARIRAQDGTYRWFLVRVSIIDGAEGPRWYGVATDIHEVKAAGEEVAASNARLTSVLASISDCYYTIDRQWRMTSVNPQAMSWVGLSEAELIGADVRQSVQLQRPFQKAILQAMRTGAPVHVERQSTFHPGRWIEFHIYPSAEGASIFFRDITARQRSQAEFDEARNLMQGSLDAMSARIALLDQNGLVIATNTAWTRDPAVRAYASHGLGAPYIDLCRSLAPELDESKVARAMRALLDGRRRSFHQPYVQSTPTGQKWSQLRINRFRQGAETRLIAVHEDVTDVARAQAALREASDRLLSIQDEERQRIAHDLHDSTSQHLVALQLGVARLRRANGAPVRVDLVLDDMADSVGEALKEIRVLSYLLNPPNLDRDGLEVTTRRFVRGFGSRTGLHTLLRTEGELDDVDPAVQRTAFRVLQEALSNVHRHANANGVEIDLTLRAGLLVLRVADDGCGVGVLETRTEEGAQLGVGIPGMRTRVEQLGGVLSIAGDQSGTVVEAQVPTSPTSLSALQASSPARA